MGNIRQPKVVSRAEISRNPDVEAVERANRKLRAKQLAELEAARQRARPAPELPNNPVADRVARVSGAQLLEKQLAELQAARRRAKGESGG